jgi:two-component system, LytTR family, response regulator
MKQLYVRHKGRHLPVNVEDIYYCEARGRTSLIYLVGGDVLCVTKTLKQLQAKLDKDVFLRVHRNTLINRYQIKEILDYKQPVIILNNGAEVIVSFRKKAELKRALFPR